MSTFDWIIQLVYVAAASCFVLGLHLMNTPATARRGNQLSTGGMVAAVAATFAIIINAGTISVTGWTTMLAGALTLRKEQGEIREQDERDRLDWERRRHDIETAFWRLLSG